ncbi:MAG: hypothetical protein QOJ63_1169 [Solirubrobacteraceae bacterium]|jgi:uncharacterized protein (TIGR04222 family)|nr:hypothetical protein [Solirubrobacteraceae bacterium]
MNDTYTWGISGTSFLWAYGILCVLTAGGIWLRRASLLSARDAGVPSGGLDAHELAMLNGGPQLAITIAATKLHRLGALAAGASGTVTGAAGRPAHGDDDIGELEHEVYDAVERDPGISSRALCRRLEERPPIQRMVSELTDRGLLLDDATRRRITWLWLWAVPVLALGVARLVAGIQNGRPIEYLALVLAAAASAMLCYAFALARPWATARGRELLDTERGGRKKLDHLPIGAEIPMAVALFGAGALWTADPIFASAWEVPRERSGFGWGTGSGGGCGGGGCGGGGGGCGGGGCGG